MTKTLREPNREDYKLALRYLKDELQDELRRIELSGNPLEIELTLTEHKYSERLNSISKQGTVLWEHTPVEHETLTPDNLDNLIEAIVKHSIAYEFGEGITIEKNRIREHGLLETATHALEKYAVDNKVDLVYLERRPIMLIHTKSIIK